MFVQFIFKRQHFDGNFSSRGQTGKSILSIRYTRDVQRTNICWRMPSRQSNYMNKCVHTGYIYSLFSAPGEILCELTHIVGIPLIFFKAFVFVLRLCGFAIFSFSCGLTKDHTRQIFEPVHSISSLSEYQSLTHNNIAHVQWA